MKAYVNYMTSVASGNIVSYGLGDWLPASTVTPTAVTDTGYYYQSALILARAAALMGNTSDSEQYSNLAAQISTSFNGAFYNTTNAEYSGGTQTAQSCACIRDWSVPIRFLPSPRHWPRSCCKTTTRLIPVFWAPSICCVRCATMAIPMPPWRWPCRLISQLGQPDIAGSHHVVGNLERDRIRHLAQSHHVRGRIGVVHGISGRHPAGQSGLPKCHH